MSSKEQKTVMSSLKKIPAQAITHQKSLAHPKCEKEN